MTKAFSERQELNECDCAIITIMSHGEEGDCEENSNIIGTDGIGVPIYKIVDYFHHDACRPLINKPKVFFFQGCRYLFCELFFQF